MVKGTFALDKTASTFQQHLRSRRNRMFLVATGISLLVLLAIVVLLLVIFVPRLLPAADQPADHQQRRECQKRSYDQQDSFVCVCSADYCDDIEPVGDVAADGQLVYFLTSRDEHRLNRFVVQQQGKRIEGGEAEPAFAEVEIRVHANASFQRVFGFGGAFSDAVGIHLNSLGPEVREQLLRAYFDPEKGIGYTIGRVPIASTDFSTRIYSYLDAADDFEAKNFALAAEDLELKIPHIIAARQLTGGNGTGFRLFASPWSAPAWMKEGGKMDGASRMKGQVLGGDDSYYRAYAKYLRRFFEEYAKRDVHFWAMTLENEPGASNEAHYWQSMHVEPEVQRQFAYHLLVPELAKSEAAKRLAIMAHDDQRDRIGADAKIYGANATEAAVLAGLAVHWYSFDDYAPLEEAHAAFPEKFILGTEASCGDQANGEVRGPQLGNWTRGWEYGHDILNDMRRWVVGWVDWNLCLDPQGGPNWFGNTIDAAIIVNASAQEFLKQPMFYFLAHFSRFIPRDSVRVASTMFSSNGTEVPPVDGFFLKDLGLVEHIAFSTPDDRIVLVLMNGDASNGQLIKVAYGGDDDNNKKWWWNIQMPADSIATAIWKK